MSDWISDRPPFVVGLVSTEERWRPMPPDNQRQVERKNVLNHHYIHEYDWPL
jgi:hypothetical protein